MRLIGSKSPDSSWAELIEQEIPRSCWAPQFYTCCQKLQIAQIESEQMGTTMVTKKLAPVTRSTVDLRWQLVTYNIENSLVEGPPKGCLTYIEVQLRLKPWIASTLSLLEFGLKISGAIIPLVSAMAGTDAFVSKLLSLGTALAALVVWLLVREEAN
ncbi:hypothetical protein TWF506_002535 [Arthrobotrys conoides]|uniref:Uncharacterized protein n=1 Tax=Arthrobotrys conoides TaxID=74498 RepID=A0AAN8N585_9PEZI